MHLKNEVNKKELPNASMEIPRKSEMASFIIIPPTFSRAILTRSFRLLPVAIINECEICTVKLRHSPTAISNWMVLIAESDNFQNFSNPRNPNTTEVIDMVTHITAIGCGMNTSATNSILIMVTVTVRIVVFNIET